MIAVNILMIAIMVAIVALSSALFGSVIGCYVALAVVSRKLTGTAWTFMDILGVFDPDSKEQP